MSKTADELYAEYEQDRAEYESACDYYGEFSSEADEYHARMEESRRRYEAARAEEENMCSEDSDPWEGEQSTPNEEQSTNDNSQSTGGDNVCSEDNWWEEEQSVWHDEETTQVSDGNVCDPYSQTCVGEEGESLFCEEDDYCTAYVPCGPDSTVVLPEASSLAIFAKDGDGNPIPSADVLVYFNLELYASGTTDSEGKFAVAYADPGDYEVTITKSDYGPASNQEPGEVNQTVTVAENESAVYDVTVFKVDPTLLVGIVTVSVLSDTNNPIEGAEVAFNATTGGTGYNGLTDVQGQYTVASAPPGTYIVEIKKDGYAADSKFIETTSSSTVEVFAGTTNSHNIVLYDIPMLVEGEVLSVTLKSGIKASRSWGASAITGKHWEKGINVNDGVGSKRSAVFRKSGPADVEVEIDIKNVVKATGNCKLTADIDGLSVEGTFPISVGTHTVSAKIVTPLDKIGWHKGDIDWNLEEPSAGNSFVLNNPTRLEVFIVWDKPAAYFNPQGVWIEVLRFLYKDVSIASSASSATSRGDTVKILAVYCHSGHGLRYDTLQGRARYVASHAGGKFKLKKYIKKTSGNVVNCYDQAGAIQSLSGTMGISVKWCFQGTPPKIYGFIKETDLVGVPGCNNPFYQSNGSAKKLPDTHPDRTAFGNHAFGDLGGKIIDACAGPHHGNENATTYLNASVDYVETTRRGHSAGKAADITYHVGVNDVV